MNETIRILYVEGLVGSGDETAAALEDAGFLVLRADSRLDALRRLDTERVDCVVCGCGASDLPIETFVERIRAGTDAPAVVLLGDSSAGNVLEGLRAGAVDYVEPGLAADRELVDRVRGAAADARVDATIDRGRQFDSLVLDAIRRVSRAESADEVEAEVQNALDGSDRYRFAWLGDFDPLTGRIDLRAPAEGEVEPDGLIDPALVERSLSTGVIVVSRQDTRETTEGELAVASVPLTTEDDDRRVLLLASDRSAAFGRSERAVLDDLANVVERTIRITDQSSGSETDRRLAEEMAHELRGLLGLVSTYLERSREDDQAIDRAESVLQRVDRTIENVLSVAGPDPLSERTAGDLRTAVEAARDRLDVEVNTVVENSIELRADHDALSRLLANLLRNTAEHAGEDATVRIGPLPGGFYVEDDGPGIPEEERERVTEWGYSTAADGTGIGLGVVREIVDAHEWELDVVEGSDGGARFEITGVDGVRS